MDELTDPLMSANFTLWACITTFILFLSIISFRLAKEMRGKIDEAQEKNLRTWGYFFLILAISNILILTWRFAFFGTLTGDIIERVANAFFFFACFLIVLNIEKSLIEANWYKRYYFSAIIFITIFINLLVPPAFLKTISPWQIVFLVVFTLGYSVFPLIYLYVSRKSSGKIRSNALKVSAGALFLALGYLFRPENIMAYYNIFPIGDLFITSLYITAPIYIVIGILLIYDSYRKIE